MGEIRNIMQEFQDIFSQPFFTGTHNIVTVDKNDSSEGGAVGGGEDHSRKPKIHKEHHHIYAPDTKTMHSYINSKNVIIGNNSTMKIVYNNSILSDSSDDDSNDDDDDDTDVTSSDSDDFCPRAEQAREEDKNMTSSNKAKQTREEEKQAKFVREFDRCAQDEQFEQIVASSRPVTDEELRAVAKDMYGPWRKFIRCLGIEDYVMDSQYTMNSRHGLDEVIYQLFMIWKKDVDLPEVGMVARALRDVGMWELAKKNLNP